MKKILLSLFYMNVAISCNNINEQNNYNYELIEDSKIDINLQINDRTPFDFPAIFPYMDISGKEYITFMSNNGGDGNSIYFYDIQNGSFVFETKLEREGPDGVGIPTGYHIENMDNIFITSHLPGITKIDTSGHKKQFIKYGLTNRGYEVNFNFFAASNVYTPIIINNNKIYITQRLYPETEISQVPISIVIDTIKNTIKELPIRFPKFITKKMLNTEYPSAHYSREFDGEHLIYSFYMDENIYITSLLPDDSSVQPIQAKSRYIKKVKPTKITDDIEYMYKNLLSISFYGNTIYDKYRNVYYRFVYIGNDVSNIKNCSYRNLFNGGRSKFSIIILDKDFKIIGETLFPEYTYNPSIAFVHKNGLYISDSHVLNPEFDENVLSFKCFTLNKITK